MNMMVMNMHKFDNRSLFSHSSVEGSKFQVISINLEPVVVQV